MTNKNKLFSTCDVKYSSPNEPIKPDFSCRDVHGFDYEVNNDKFLAALVPENESIYFQGKKPKYLGNILAAWHCLRNKPVIHKIKIEGYIVFSSMKNAYILNSHITFSHSNICSIGENNEKQK